MSILIKCHFDQVARKIILVNETSPKNMLIQLLGAFSRICQNFNPNGHVSQIEQLQKNHEFL
jgi:hypothetical protein